MTSKRQIRADLALLFVTLIWGSTFVAVQEAVGKYPVFGFLAIRFGMATLAMLLLFGRRLKSLGWWGWGAGALIGLLLFAGYTLQTTGLKYTSATKAGLITGLQTVSVPIIAAIWTRRMPKRQILLATAVAVIGLALVSLQGDLSIQRGDLLVLGCAISFGAHITAVGFLAPRTDALGLTIVQIAFVAAASAVASYFEGGIPLPMPQDVFNAAAFTGILATALAFGVQNSVSKYTTPTHTGVVFAMEPVFAAIFGYLLMGERLEPRALFGGCMILLAMFIAELREPVASARFVSYFLNPIYWLGIVFVVAAMQGVSSTWEGLAWAAFVLAVSVGFPILFLLDQRRRGRISDWHITRREERVQLPLIVMALLAAVLPLVALQFGQGPRALQAVFATGLALIVVSIAITFIWKVSQHMIGITALSTMLTILVGPFAAPSFLLVPVVAWARITVGAHTRWQTIVGGLVGLCGPLLVFRAFGLV